MNYTLYILQNSKSRHYIGITSLEPQERLKRHNKGNVYSTQYGKPWRLIHIEKFLSIQEARAREKKIKSWHGGNAIKKLLAKSAGSSNGRTSPLGGDYLGSNPSPAALAKRK